MKLSMERRFVLLQLPVLGSLGQAAVGCQTPVAPAKKPLKQASAPSLNQGGPGPRHFLGIGTRPSPPDVHSEEIHSSIAHIVFTPCLTRDQARASDNFIQIAYLFCNDE